MKNEAGEISLCAALLAVVGIGAVAAATAPVSGPVIASAIAGGIASNVLTVWASA